MQLNINKKCVAIFGHIILRFLKTYKRRKKVVKYILRKLKKMGVVLMICMMTLCISPVGVLADETTPAATEGVADFLKNGDSNGGIFSGLVDKIKTIGQDIYTLLLVLGVVCLVVCVAILGITQAATKKGTTQHDNKGWAFNIAIGGLFIFGAVTIVGLIGSIAGSI